MVMGKVLGRDLAEYQSRIVQRFTDAPNMVSGEQSESEIDEESNIVSTESESISFFSSLGTIVLTAIALSFLLFGIILIRFRRDIFEDFI